MLSIKRIGMWTIGRATKEAKFQVVFNLAYLFDKGFPHLESDRENNNIVAYLKYLQTKHNSTQVQIQDDKNGTEVLFSADRSINEHSNQLIQYHIFRSTFGGTFSTTRTGLINEHGKDTSTPTWTLWTIKFIRKSLWIEFRKLEALVHFPRRQISAPGSPATPSIESVASVNKRDTGQVIFQIVVNKILKE